MAINTCSVETFLKRSACCSNPGRGAVCQRCPIVEFSTKCFQYEESARVVSKYIHMPYARPSTLTATNLGVDFYYHSATSMRTFSHSFLCSCSLMPSMVRLFALTRERKGATIRLPVNGWVMARKLTDCHMCSNHWGCDGNMNIQERLDQVVQLGWHIDPSESREYS